MALSTQLKSPIVAIVRCFKANRRLWILHPLALAIIAASSYFSGQANKCFGSLLQLYQEDRGVEAFAMVKIALGHLTMHYLTQQCFSFISKFCGSIIHQSFLCESLRKYSNLEYTEFHAIGSGRIQEDIHRSSKAARDATVSICFDIPRSLIEFLFAIHIIYVYLSSEMFLLFNSLFYISISFAFFIAIFSSRRERMLLGMYRKSIIPLSDILYNFDIMKSFNNEDREIETYKQSLGTFIRWFKRYAAEINTLAFLQKVIMLLPHLFVFYKMSIGYPIWRDAKENRMTEMISMYNAQYQVLKKSTLVFRDRVFGAVKECAEMKGDIDFVGHRPDDTAELLTKTSFNRQIRLHNVDLYAGNSQIQKGQSFTINKGEKVAITGTNGAGKSVFLKTLLKFFKSEGEFYIDDVLIEKISPKSIRNLIGYVPQDPHIFNNTVLYNLGYSQQRMNEEQIYECCKDFGLHEFFESLRNGYHTEAGEHGKYLSGGQKQRISLMRALIKDPPILVMDEPTASIDRASELELIDRIIEKCNDRTFLLIVHNDELLKKFDKVLYFTKDGVTCVDNHKI